MVFFAATNGYMDVIPETDVRRYEKELIEFSKQKHSHVLKNIAEKKQVSDDIKKTVVATLEEFKAVFQPSTAK